MLDSKTLWGVALVVFSGCGGDDLAVDAGPRPDADFPDAELLDTGIADAATDGGPQGDAGELGWRAEPSLPLPLQEMSAAVVDGEIWVVGGFEGARVVGTTRRFDPLTGAWAEGPALPVPRHHVTLAVLDGSLYAIGGMLPGGFQSVEECYVLRSGAGAWEAIAPLPAPRAAAVAAGIGDAVVVAAGQGRGGALLEPALRYLPVENRWEAGASIPTPREHLGGFGYAGELWVLGGRENNLRTNKTVVEIYDPSEDSWRLGPSLQVPRGGFAAAVFGDVAVAVGGEQPGRALDEAELLQLPDGEWELIDPVPTPRHGHGMAAVNGRFYVVGGADEPIFAAVDAVESFRLE